MTRTDDARSRHRGLASVLESLGQAVLVQGDAEHAQALFAQSLRLGQELGSKSAFVLEGFAGLAGTQGQADRAARLYGAAEALREATHRPIQPFDRSLRERLLTAARAQLDAAAWQAAWAEGRAMPLEQAIAYALEPTATFP